MEKFGVVTEEPAHKTAGKITEEHRYDRHFECPSCKHTFQTAEPGAHRCTSCGSTKAFETLR